MPRKKLNPVSEDAEVIAEANEPAPEETAKPVARARSKFAYPGIESEGIKVRHFNPGGDAERMYDYMSKQPKSPFFVPLGIGEKPGATQWCQMNDLAVIIDKNRFVMLPKPMADHLMESLKLSSDALHPYVTNGDGQRVLAESVSSNKELN